MQSDEESPGRNGWRDETAGDEVCPRRNGWRSVHPVPTTKWQATKCTPYTRDEMAGDEVYPQRNGGDETAATKRPARSCFACYSFVTHITAI